MTCPPYSPQDRRPLKSRDWSLSERASVRLADWGVSPNSISVFGMLAGLAAGAALALTPFVLRNEGAFATRAVWLTAAVLIQARLLANLFDGMVAVRTGRASPLGELYNEIPDRVSDAAIFIGAGFAVGGSPAAGELAALFAVATAYVRAVGKAAAGRNDYCGPMAKPQRMAAMTVVCVVLTLTPSSWWTFASATEFGPMAVALLLVALGSFATCVRRVRRIARTLAQTAPSDV